MFYVYVKFDNVDGVYEAPCPTVASALSRAKAISELEGVKHTAVANGANLGDEILTMFHKGREF